MLFLFLCFLMFTGFVVLSFYVCWNCNVVGFTLEQTTFVICMIVFSR
jgi:hypothetical protein